MSDVTQTNHKCDVLVLNLGEVYLSDLFICHHYRIKRSSHTVELNMTQQVEP